MTDAIASGQEVVLLNAWAERRHAIRARDRIVFSPVFVVVGVFLLWLGLPTSGRAPSVLLIGVGILVVALGPVYFWGVGRELNRECQSVVVGEDGIRLGLRNGESLLVGWTDSSLNLSIWERRLRGLPDPDYVLHCRMAGGATRAYITKGGADLIDQFATRNGLHSELKLDHFGSITRIRAKTTFSGSSNSR